jgi:uncharacterized protein YndB with AHSA1/START domain
VTRELVFTRTVAAPRDLVFRCLTEPEHLTAFWGPKGTSAPLATIVAEPRPGGAFTTVMVNDADGSSYTMRAVYDDVAPPHRLAWTELGSGMRTEITFDDLGDGRTGVRIHQTDVPPGFDAPDAQAGFLSSLDRFDDHLATLVTHQERP